jgi:hypothetical protein
MKMVFAAADIITITMTLMKYLQAGAERQLISTALMNLKLYLISLQLKRIMNLVSSFVQRESFQIRMETGRSSTLFQVSTR